jgi:DNA mismatch repair protein MutS2
MRIYPPDSLETFGFPKIIQLIESHCQSASARKLCLSVKPYEDEALLKLVLQRCHEYVGMLRANSFIPSFNFPDISKENEYLRISNYILTEESVLNIREVSDIANSLLRYFKEKTNVLPALCSLSDGIPFTTEIIDAIDRIIDSNRYVKSTASKDLARIRKDLTARRRELDKLFNHQINKYRKLGWITDAEETVYNGHRVLSVFAEFKKSVKGIIVGSSDTGKTTFIEPIETIEISNDVFELELEEKREIQLILKELTDELRKNREAIKGYFRFLTQLDLIRAKALFAIDINACLPTIVNKAMIRYKKATHPLLYLQNKKQNKPTIPFDLTLDFEDRILIISGPNAGGKSITLKTIGLLQMMIQSGLLIPVEEGSELGFFNFLLTDIGDSQSIEDELSTYSSRLLKMKRIVDLADKNALVLIDEFGTGSDPDLGGAIAEAILEDLSEKKAIGIITSHYMNIKLAGTRLDGVFNGCMLFNDETLKPLYELSLGQPGSSYTFQVAQKIGLQKHITQKARAKINAGNLSVDTLLSKLQKEKGEISMSLQRITDKEKRVDAEREKYQNLFKQYTDLAEKRKLSREDDMKIMELGRRFNVLINEYEYSKDKKTVIKKFIKSAEAEQGKKMDSKKREDEFSETDKERQARIDAIKVGAEVCLVKGKLVGVVQELSKNKARVLFGNAITTVAIDNLMIPKKEEKPKNKTAKPAPKPAQKRKSAVTKTDLPNTTQS